MADPVITPQRALGFIAMVADDWELFEADGGNVMTPQRRLHLYAAVADCYNILEGERQRVENGVQQQAAVQSRNGGSALAPDAAR